MQKPRPIYITQKKLDELKAELSDLNSKLPAMIRETGEMAALGDRSENAGYQNAKALMRRTQNKIRYLEKLIPRCKITEKSNSGKVEIGSKVQIQDISSNQTYEYTIVDSLQADPAKGFISYHSPIAKILLGKSTGETVEHKTKRYFTSYKIVSIQ